ncbi:hypothetical protein V7919_003447 [Escherichia coli]
MMIPAGPDNKKARDKAGNKHEGNSNAGSMAEDTLAGSGMWWRAPISRLTSINAYTSLRYWPVLTDMLSHHK